MTEKDVHETQDAALGRYMRLKRTHAIALERATVIAREMSDFSSELRGGARKFMMPGFQMPAWINREIVAQLISDISTAETEMQKARDHAMTLGVALERNQ